MNQSVKISKMYIGTKPHTTYKNGNFGDVWVETTEGYFKCCNNPTKKFALPKESIEKDLANGYLREYNSTAIPSQEP